jgi:hypothetical protein
MAPKDALPQGSKTEPAWKQKARDELGKMQPDEVDRLYERARRAYHADQLSLAEVTKLRDENPAPVLLARAIARIEQYQRGEIDETDDPTPLQDTIEDLDDQPDEGGELDESDGLAVVGDDSCYNLFQAPVTTAQQALFSEIDILRRWHGTSASATYEELKVLDGGDILSGSFSFLNRVPRLLEVLAGKEQHSLVRGSEAADAATLELRDYRRLEDHEGASDRGGMGARLNNVVCTGATPAFRQAHRDNQNLQNGCAINSLKKERDILEAVVQATPTTTTPGNTECDRPSGKRGKRNGTAAGVEAGKK